MNQHQQYLLEVRGSNGAFWGNLDLVLFAGPLIDDSEGTLEVRRRRGSGCGGEMERVDRGGVGVGGGK